MRQIRLNLLDLAKPACILINFFFVPIKKNNLRTGIKREKTGKEPSAMAVPKADCQAFGVIVSKSISKEDAFVHPITSLL